MVINTYEVDDTCDYKCAIAKTEESAKFRVWAKVPERSTLISEYTRSPL